MWTLLHRKQRRADLFQRGSSEFRDPAGNTIVAVFGMATSITIKVISHMYEFFRHNDFKPVSLIQVDAIEMDQDGMEISISDETICASVGGRHLPSKPIAIDSTIGGNP